MTSLWYVGVGLEIVSTMSGTVGKQLIRLSVLWKRSNPRCARLCFFSGLVINTALGPIIDMGAYSFAAQSLIAPFGGLDVVWNAMLAPYVLKETLTAGRALGCVFIVAGTLLAGCFGNHQEAEYTIEYVEDTVLNIRVLLYFIGFFAWFLVNQCFLMRFPEGSTVRGLSLGCTAGTISGNMFCVKAAIELIQRSIHEQDGEIWLHWLPYVMVAGAIFFAVTNVGYMTQGLKEYEALFMVTIYEGSMIVSGCTSGAIVLRDLRHLEAWRICLYGLGVLIIMLGMYVMFSQEAQQKSSLVANTASIQRGDKKLPDLKNHSVYAACSAENNQSPNSKNSRSSVDSDKRLSPRRSSSPKDVAKSSKVLGNALGKAAPPTAPEDDWVEVPRFGLASKQPERQQQQHKQQHWQQQKNDLPPSILGSSRNTCRHSAKMEP